MWLVTKSKFSYDNCIPNFVKFEVHISMALLTEFNTDLTLKFEQIGLLKFDRIDLYTNH